MGLTLPLGEGGRKSLVSNFARALICSRTPTALQTLDLYQYSHDVKMYTMVCTVITVSQYDMCYMFSPMLSSS